MRNGCPIYILISPFVKYLYPRERSWTRCYPNFYLGTDCFRIVEHIGKNEFVIIIQKEGEIIQQISTKPKEIRKAILLKGYELYLDSTLKANAKIDFTKKTDCV